MTIQQKIEEAAIKRGQKQNSTGCAHMDAAISRLLRIGFEDGANFTLTEVTELLENCRTDLNAIIKGEGDHQSIEFIKHQLRYRVRLIEEFLGEGK